MPLVRAVVELLGDWRPPVEAVVAVESATRPTLTRELAEGIARHLGVPVTARWAIVDPDVAPGRGAANSAQRVAAVGRRTRSRARSRPAPVLLVDDQVVTGWSVTLAARAVRAAGATEVRPLVLALNG